MSIPPKIVASARIGWRWQWNQLMNGLAPADKAGNYLRPPSKHKNSIVLEKFSSVAKSGFSTDHSTLG